MNKKLCISILLLSLLCLGIVGQALAQTRLPGVHYGDNFVYSLVSNWSSSNSSLTVPSELVDFNSTLSFNVTVTAVQGVNVTAMTVQRFGNNSTDDNRLITMNVDSGSNYFMNGFAGFFDANLGAGDLLRPSGNDTNPVTGVTSESVRINQTIPRTYASGTRDTNVVTVSYPVIDASNTTLGTQTITYYIDKAVGVLVERKDYTEFPDQNGTELWTLKSTNVWTVSPPPLELPLPILIAVVAVVVVIVVAVVYRGRKGRRKRSRR